MSRRSVVLLALLLGVCPLIATALAWPTLDGPRPAQALLPADPTIYFAWDGTDRDRAAWEKTALYASLEKSGLLPTLAKVALTYVPPGNEKEAEAIGKVLRRVVQKGASLAVTFPQDAPSARIILILHDAAELEPVFRANIARVAGSLSALETKTVRGRKVTRAQFADPETTGRVLGMWVEGGNIVFAYGHDAIESALDIADGKAPALAPSPLWSQLSAGPAGATSLCREWLDVAAIERRFGEHVLQEADGNRSRLTVAQVLKALGLDRLRSVVFRCGFRDASLVSESMIDAPAPRTGLLALADQREMTLADLPPLPKQSAGVAACRFDWSKAYDVLAEAARETANARTPEGAAEVDKFLSQDWPANLGFELKRDLLDPLGDVACLHGEPGAAVPAGLGVGVAIRVKDAARLTKTIKGLLEKLQSNLPNQLTIATEEHRGRPVFVCDIADAPLHPSLCIDKNWMFLALSPQAVDDSLQRLDGKLEGWKPSAEEQAALDAVPKKFVSIALADPRPSYSALLSLMPVLLSANGPPTGPRAGGRPGTVPGERIQLLSELPPPDAVTRPMFPNVTTWTVDARGIHSQSRESVPSLVSVPTITMGVALLLPAVSAAREAARRTQSKNNIKQIALALHNYHEANGSFPQGTHPNKGLKPAQRLSWLADILPYVEQSALEKQIDFTKAWDDPRNKPAASTPIITFLNPGVGIGPQGGPAQSHYVGLAGLGVDGPTLHVTSPKAGCFAYDRGTRLADIGDGTSNTVFVSEASKDFGAWAAGGRPTIRSLTKRPYVNGPDGIGGPYRGGVNMGLADGSVRFLSTRIDPKVLEALVTINGGEVINSAALQPNP